MEIQRMSGSKFRVQGARIFFKGVVIAAFCILGPARAGGAVADGYVVKVDSTTLYLDWGQSSGVKPGDGFKVYRAGEALKHPVTGEPLGRTQEDLGQGVLERVEDKFSIGVLVGSRGGARAGDRTRHMDAFSGGPAPTKGSGPLVVSAADTGQPSAPALRELWRSAPLDATATGMAIGDVDGDGQNEVILAFVQRLDVYRWDGTALVSIASYKPRGSRNWLAVEAFPGADGRARIFATNFIEGIRRPRLSVLEWRDGALREIQHEEGFVRAVDRAGGKKTLVWMGLSMAREYRVLAPLEFVPGTKGYERGERLALPRPLNDDQLLGYTYGDWDGDGSEDFAVLTGGERLRLFFKNSNWSASESYGGTRNGFTAGTDGFAVVYPRIQRWAAHGKDALIVPHNIPQLGIRLTHLKLFKSSELLALAWNGLEMAPVWKLSLPAYLADYAIGDGLGRGGSQLWVATVGPGDKTVLLAYSLPE